MRFHVRVPRLGVVLSNDNGLRTRVGLVDRRLTVEILIDRSTLEKRFAVSRRLA
jgi:hypothetical protein